MNIEFPESSKDFAFRTVKRALYEKRVVKAKDWAGNWFIIFAAWPTCHEKFYVHSLFGGKFLTSEISIK